MFLMGIDIGTSGAKSAIFNCRGEIMGLASKDYTFETVKPGYAEQDPQVWWDAVETSARMAVEKSKVKKEEILAIGLSGQMHGMIPLDREGNVIRKAILHCDVRASAEVNEIREMWGREYETITYNPVFPGFQAVSLYWLKKHEPENFHKIFKVICPKDYIRYRMTGEIGTEHTDASGTLLYDMEKAEWSDVIFEKLGFDRSIVPDKIANSCDVAGTLTEEAAGKLGLAAGTLVAYGGGDQAMQSTGNGIYRPGITTVTIGTSGQVLSISNRPPFNEKLNTHTFRHVEDGTWFGLGAVLFAGSTLNWFKRNFCEDVEYEALSELADGIPPCSEGLVFFPCMGGERTPYLDSRTEGMFSGITMVHGKTHFIRAVMEGVTFAMKGVIATIQSLYGEGEKLICAGGGVKGKVWAQIQADIYGQDIWISKIKEQACLGAAIVAGVAAQVFPNLGEACEAMCDKNMCMVHPREENVELYRRFYDEVYSRIYDSNAELFHRINDFTK